MTTVIVPWRAGCAHREAALGWVTGRYEPLGYAVVVSEHTAGEWRKPAAILAAATAAPEGPLVIADSDVWCDALGAAVEAVRTRPWAVPHRLVHRLTQRETARVLTGRAPDLSRCVQPPYRGTAAGGIVVIQRSVLLDIPPDPRFAGWGGEDAAWRDALRCLAGMEWRDTRAPLLHLWHPPAARTVRHGTEANARLVARYKAARYDPAAMRALITEAP